MQKSTLVLLALLLTAPLRADALNGGSLSAQTAKISQRCSPGPNKKPPQPVLSSERDEYTPEQLGSFFKDTYEKGNRLTPRVYFDTQTGSYVTGKSSVIPGRFIQSIISHIETALSKGYAQWVIFDDMGHGHVYTAPDSINESLESILADDRTRVLYHVGEYIDFTPQGQLTQDPSLLKRFLNRNIVGDASGGVTIESAFDGKITNTVRGLTGGVERKDVLVYLHANKDGCFTYNSPEGEFRFDIRL